jgi:hypothetical protein
MLDDCGAMQTQDAHILQSNYTYRPATRWQELVDCVLYHADLAVRLHWPTRVALVNPTVQQQQHFALHQPHANGQLIPPAQEYQILQQALRNVIPQGPSAESLLEQLRLLREYIVGLADSLRAQHQRVSVIIGTQGLLVDAQGCVNPNWKFTLTQALNSFAGLPVAFVLRLCTDDEHVLDFYNTLDAHIPLPFDVLDDFYGEALEVYLRNPWLCYAIVLHRVRELGYSMPALDEMDERGLTLTELHSFVQFLFGVTLPLPQQNWSLFCHRIQECQAREVQHWNPVLKCVTPWINMSLLQSIYGPLASHIPAPQQPRPNASTTFTTSCRPSSHQPTSSTQSFQQPASFAHPTTPPSTHTQGTSSIHPPSGADSHPHKTTHVQTTTQLIPVLERQWSKVPPQYTHIKPLTELLATLSTDTFTVVPHHVYFDKFHPFAPGAFITEDTNVVKRAVRKVRLLLHPDKLPSDLSDIQQALCRYIWDTISEAWEKYN